MISSSASSRITFCSRTLIDNKFFSSFDNEIFFNEDSSNSFWSFFSILPHKKVQLKTMIKKPTNITLKLLIEVFFKKDSENIIWDEILKTENTTVNRSFDNFINNFNELLSFHTPIRIISIKEKELPSKPWITNGILTFINAKNRIYGKYCKTKIHNTKEELYKSPKFHLKH